MAYPILIPWFTVLHRYHFFHAHVHRQVHVDTQTLSKANHRCDLVQSDLPSMSLMQFIWADEFMSGFVSVAALRPRVVMWSEQRSGWRRWRCLFWCSLYLFFFSILVLSCFWVGQNCRTFSTGQISKASTPQLRRPKLNQMLWATQRWSTLVQKWAMPPERSVGINGWGWQGNGRS